MHRSLLVLFPAALCLTLTAAPSWASSITIDAFTTPQLIEVPGAVAGTSSSVVTGSGILGGSRTMTITTTTSGSPFALRGAVLNGRARLEGLVFGSMLLEWDANGAGLDLDLSDMLGLTIGRATSDGGFDLIVRLLSANNGMLLLTASLDDSTAIGDLPPGGHPYRVGTYTFDRFQEIGQPNLHDIDAIQIELVRSGGVAGVIGDLSFAPTRVPESSSSLTFMALALFVGAIYRVLTSA